MTKPLRWDRPELVFRLLAPVIVKATERLFRLHVVGAERLPRWGPALLAVNHVSLFDPLVVFAVLYRAGRRARFLAVSDLWDIPVLGWLLRRGRMIPVVRGKGPWRMVRHASAAMDAGQAVVIYPEGHIAPPDLPPGRTQPGRTGAGTLALRSHAPVVPMRIIGLRRSNPRWWRLPPREVTVIVGDPVPLSRLRESPDGKDTALQASEAMLAAVRALVVPPARATPDQGTPGPR